MPAAKQLLSSLRTGFTSGGAVTLQQLKSSSSPQVATIQSNLDVLDEVLNEVEASASQVPATPSPAPTSGSTPAPVAEPVAVSPSVVQAQPLVQPQPPLETVAQAVPMAVAQATDTLNPQTTAVRSFKEVSQPAVTTENPAVQPVDLGGGYQLVEVERSSELPPEVDGFIQEVQEHEELQPQEIVVADGSIQLQPTQIPMKKVVVLPITPEVEKAGAHKASKYSLRWLVEWSRRLMKMFSGKIIYSQETT